MRSDRSSRPAAAITFQRRSLSLARLIRASLSARRPFGGDRLASLTAVGLVAVALVVSNLGTDAIAGPTGGTSGAGSEPRIALGGAVAGIQGAPLGGIVADGAADIGLDGSSLSASASGLAPDDRITIDGPFGSDGTLLKPVSVDTTVADGKDLMRS